MKRNLRIFLLIGTLVLVLGWMYTLGQLVNGSHVVLASVMVADSGPILPPPPAELPKSQGVEFSFFTLHVW